MFVKLGMNVMPLYVPTFPVPYVQLSAINNVSVAIVRINEVEGTHVIERRIKSFVWENV
jgi:hypothetical protein